MTGTVAAELTCSAALTEPIRALVQARPGVPLLTLGQTVFWDEPMKAVVQEALRDMGLDAPMVLAVHDTDYFARPHATLVSAEPYRIVPHNDGSTRSLWCAAAEISRLFGAETVPTRSALRQAGVRLHLAARAREESVHDLLDRVTEAWGWRGIVQTSGVEILTHEVSLRPVLPALLELLDWAFSGTAESMCHCIGARGAENMAGVIRAAVIDAAAKVGDGGLSDLYQRLFPEMHALLAGEDARNHRVSHSIAESRFNPETASARRFRILDLFLQPATREICIRAYNRALHGSDIYTLDKFGEGAIPFDLVTPGLGRATIHVLDNGIQLEGRRSEFLPTAQRVESAEQLAALVCGKYGPEISLVGKAVTWIAIMAADHIFVFAEGASSYTSRTRQMLDEMRQHGISLELNPILRVRYDAWDALSAVPSGFCLPDHYAEAFGKREIAAAEFAERWRAVMAEQETLLTELGNLSSTTDLLAYLNARTHGGWGDLCRAYDEARSIVRAANAGVPALQREARAIRAERYQLGLEIDRMQKRLGELRRSMLHSTGAGSPTNAQASVKAERTELQQQMDERRQRRGALLERRRELQQESRALRQDRRYGEALDTLRSVEARGELERLRLARNSYLVAHSLEHNNRRPTAWWLPMVSPDGAWFRRVLKTASAYIEPL